MAGKISAKELSSALLSSFAPSGYGIGSVAKSLSGIDLNTIYLGGFYYCSSCSNIPSGTGNGHMIVLSIGSNISQQIYFPYGYADKMYIRVNQSGTWTAWKQVVTTDAPTFTGLTTISNNNTQLSLTDTIANKSWQLGTNVGSAGTHNTFGIYSTEWGVSNGYNAIVTINGTTGNTGLGGVTSPQATIHGAGTTILGGMFNASIWNCIGNSQINMECTGANKTLTFRWRDSSGAMHSYGLVSTD